MPPLKAPRRATPKLKRRAGSRILGVTNDSSPQIVQQIRAGLPFSRLKRFQKTTAMPWAAISHLIALPARTLNRRQIEGRLQPDESDRLWRIAAIFDLAVDLFEGDAVAARRWLESPQRGLGGAIPLEFAASDVGAREVENLIGRLEHGVFV